MKTIIAITLVGLLALLGAGYIHPPSRPYVRKYGWLALLPFGILLGLFLSAGRGPRPAPGTHSEQAKDTIRSIADFARAQSADADAELARRRLAAQAVTTTSRERLASFEERLAEARGEADPGRRRQALLELLAETRT